MFSKKPEIKIFAGADAMSRAAAEKIIEHLSESLQTHSVYSIVLSGGSTPKRLYAMLAGDAELRKQIPWERIHFFWGDERHVPPNHPDSNYHTACEAMLSKVPVPPPNIHRMRGEDPDAGKIAADYEREIRRFFKMEIGEVPRFNCVLLGMGSDGHTASLFPGTPALRESNHLVVANWVHKFNSFRITLTAPVLNNAECILFLVSGDQKADILKTVLEGPRAPFRYPAQLIQPRHGSIKWFLDRSAAKRLVSVQHG